MSAAKAVPSERPLTADSDEDYVVALCERLIARPALRRYTFDWLRGEPDARGRRRRIPVGAYWPEFALVVEYHRAIAKPMPRDPSAAAAIERRVLADEQRRSDLSLYGIHLVDVSSEDLAHRGTRLTRDHESDLLAMRAILGGFARR